MEEGLDSVDDICFNNIPIFLIEECKYAIRTKSFVRT